MSTIQSRIQLKRDTTENWNANSNFIPLKGEMIIYTDRYQVTKSVAVRDAEGDPIFENGEKVMEDKVFDVPGLKIGDGLAYLIDLPFVDDELTEQLTDHIQNGEIHFTAKMNQEEKNNQIVEGETLLFTPFV